MNLLLCASSAVALGMLVVHSWRARGRAVTLWFFVTALAFGILRGNVVWFIVSGLGADPDAVKPYLPQAGLLPEVGHDSLQVALGWVFALYLAWTVSERLLRRLPKYSGRVFAIAGVASLFMAAIGYCMETAAVAAGWWYWALPTRTLLFGNVNGPGMWAWFSVAPDFLMPFLVIAGSASTSKWKWLWLAVFPLHMGAHFLYGRVPHAWTVYPLMTLLVVGLAFFGRLRMARGEAATADRVTASLPGAALGIFFAVLVAADLFSGGGARGLMTIVPMGLLCLLAWRRVPVWLVVLVSVVALGGWAWVGPRALYALLPVATLGFFALLERLHEPPALKLVPAVIVVALAAWAIAVSVEDGARDQRYVDLWQAGDRALLAGDEKAAEGFYRDADATRPHDAYYLYCDVRDMATLERTSLEKSVTLFEARLPRLLRELEEVVRRDPDWLTPREDIARLWVVAGNVPEAVRQYREMVRLQPGNVELQSSLGYLLLRDADPAEAEPVLARAVASRRPPAEAMIDLGVIRWSQRRDAEAKALWERALACSPSHPAARWDLDRMSDPSADRRIDVEYLACRPVVAVARLLNDIAAYSRALSGDGKVRMLVESTQLDPSFARAHLNLAGIYLAPTSRFHDPRRGLLHARRAEACSKDASERDESRRLLDEALRQSDLPR